MLVTTKCLLGDFLQILGHMNLELRREVSVRGKDLRLVGVGVGVDSVSINGRLSGETLSVMRTKVGN